MYFIIWTRYSLRLYESGLTGERDSHNHFLIQLKSNVFDRTIYKNINFERCKCIIYEKKLKDFDVKKLKDFDVIRLLNAFIFKSLHLEKKIFRSAFEASSLQLYNAHNKHWT
jgi:hypothetical protein